MEKVSISCLFFISSLLLLLLILTTTALDTITTTQSLKDGDTLVSSGGTFEMGFFSPGISKLRYVGIWYKQISETTVVWVANREIPLSTPQDGLLKVVGPGILVLHNLTSNAVWATRASREAKNPVAQILDSGNLVVRDADDENPENYLWQSFDYPTDTVLPGMKFGRNLVTGRDWFLSSWKSQDDPAPGEYTWRCDPRGYPQNILKQGDVEIYRGGPWNGIQFSGATGLRPNDIYTYNMTVNDKETFFTYSLVNTSIYSKFALMPDGTLERGVWVDKQKDWVVYVKLPKDNCDSYALCGAYGSCNISTSPECGCLDRFVPKDETGWGRADWSGGCVRRAPLNCENGTDVFLKYTNVKLPDTRLSWVNRTMNLQQCNELCFKNCSCSAYANLNITGGGSGCLLWFGDLIDVRVYPTGGQDIYIRLSSSELVASTESRRTKERKILLLLPIFLLGVLLVALCLILYFRRKRKINMRRKGEESLWHESEQDYTNESKNKSLELPLFDFSTISNATDSFSLKHKLGEGGFGPVYKGVLEDGQEIAIKRLSKTSSQGLEEFKNEVIFISKLQHRNLVRLLGCCIRGEEKLLIYEYMPNRSLDSFIFDKSLSSLLDWPKRVNIINGIARGLLYLHQDSRLRIIHRDLKASNILLDDDMNPKISDFGIARSFGGNQTQASTERVVGTYGYMSPEYAIDGLFSIKSDVFSFGVLVLEIVSGRRNRGFVHEDHQHNLVGHAWRLHNEGRSMELLDTTVDESCFLSEVVRSIQVGLLCVQQSPEDRPSMSSVVLMLAGEGPLPQPKQPGFFTERSVIDSEFSSSTYPTGGSANEFTTTAIEAR